MQSQETQSPDGSDVAEIKKTIDWAKESGYQPTAAGLRRRDGKGKLPGFLHRRLQSPAATQPAVATPPAVAQPAATPPVATQPAAPARPTAVIPPKVLTPDWSRGATLTKTLKGDHDKNVAMIDVDGRILVLKGAMGTVPDHVAATQFMDKLGLKGVQVPQTRLLDAGEKAAVIQALSGQAQNDSRANNMIQALRLGDGQVSEQVVKGRALDKIIPTKAIQAALKESLSLRESIAGDQEDKAWAAAFSAAVGKEKRIGTNQNYSKWSGASDQASRQQTVQELRSQFVKFEMLPLFDVLAEIAGGDKTRQQGLDQARADAAAVANDRTQLESFARSDDGVTAFAGVAVSDLVSGMHDRMVGVWNGGNFMFDSSSQQFCCVDNNKEPNIGLTAPDAAQWKKDFFDMRMQNGALEDALYEKIYGEVFDEDAPCKYVRFTPEEAENAKRIIRNVLAKAVQRIEGDPSFDPAAKERAAVLGARMELDDLLRLPPNLPQPPPLPPELDAKQKASRTLSAAFSGENAKRAEAKKIKNDLREGHINGQEALDKLKKLESSSKTLSGDRRGAKIRFLAAAVSFCEQIGERADDLDKFIRDDQAGVWSDGMGADLQTKLSTAFNEWLQASANDQAILTRLHTTWGKFQASVRAG